MSSYIVVFDDEQDACWPMCWDDSCAGALCVLTAGPIALFDSRAAARRAIRISTAYAKLCQAQGKPANEDFLDCIKFVKVRATGGSK